MFATLSESSFLISPFCQVPSGGGGGVSAAAPAAGGAPAAAAEEKKEEKEEEKVRGLFFRFPASNLICNLPFPGRVRRRHGLRSLRLNMSVLYPCAMQCTSFGIYYGEYFRKTRRLSLPMR